MYLHRDIVILTSKTFMDDSFILLKKAEEPDKPNYEFKGFNNSINDETCSCWY